MGSNMTNIYEIHLEIKNKIKLWDEEIRRFNDCVKFEFDNRSNDYVSFVDTPAQRMVDYHTKTAWDVLKFEYTTNIRGNSHWFRHIIKFKLYDTQIGMITGITGDIEGSNYLEHLETSLMETLTESGKQFDFIFGKEYICVVYYLETYPTFKNFMEL